MEISLRLKAGLDIKCAEDQRPPWHPSSGLHSQPPTPSTLMVGSENEFLSPKAQKQKHNSRNYAQNSHLLNHNISEPGGTWEAHIL